MEQNKDALSLTPQVSTVRMVAPEDTTSISVRGVEYTVPESGVVEAPADIAAELASHGFTPAKPDVVEKAAPSKRRALTT